MLYNNLTTDELLNHAFNDVSDNALVSCLATRLEKSEVDEVEISKLNGEIASLEEIIEDNDYRVTGYDETLEAIQKAQRKHITGQPYDFDGGLLDQTDEIIDLLETTINESSDKTKEIISLERKIETLEAELYEIKRGLKND